MADGMGLAFESCSNCSGMGYSDHGRPWLPVEQCRTCDGSGIVKIDPSPITIDLRCQHEPLQYIGLTDTFFYCKKCDEKLVGME